MHLQLTSKKRANPVKFIEAGESRKPEKIDVIILCGGLGTRLRPVIDDQPKVLVKIGEKTFLDLLIDDLVIQGFKNIILNVGYLKEQIRKHFISNKRSNCTIRFSEEDEPLGTGGALKNAIPLIKNDFFMAMNGDSICKVDLRNFIDFHIEKEALLSIVLASSKTAKDYGSVALDELQRITSFNEKVVGKSENLINAGIYLMDKVIFSDMPNNSFSLEYDLFPKVIVSNRCYGFLTNSKVIDIGTPERYEKAIDLLK